MAGQVVSDIQAFSQRDIRNRVVMVDMKSTPLFSMIPKGDQEYGNVLMEWPMDKELDPEHTATPDAKDQDTFENPLSTYAQARNYQQWFRPKGWQLGKIAKLQNMPGNKDKKAKMIAKKIKQLKRMLECSLGSDLPTVAWAGAVGGQSRGIGECIASTAQTVEAIPAAFLTASGCIDSTASASVTETIVQNVMQASYEETGEKKTFSLVCGPAHKKIYRGFTEKATASTNVMSSIRTFNQDGASKKIVATVDIYEGDFGVFELLESLWLAFYKTSDPTKTRLNEAAQKAISNARAYGLDMNNWEWQGSQAPKSEEYPNLGGGERGSVDAIGGLRCLNPRAEIKFAGTT